VVRSEPSCSRLVPGPVAGAELPALIAACGVMLMLARRRRHELRENLLLHRNYSDIAGAYPVLL
jgi:hypothetical protein